MNNATVLARHLLSIKAVQLDPETPFTWASGLLSPIYCDNRVTLSYPEVRRFIKTALAQESAFFGPFDVVAGVATAGIPHGVLLADALDKPFVYVRSGAKDHGRRNQIEGIVHPQQRVLVVEDLISTGGSSLAAVEVLREAACEVAGVLALFQYGFAKAALAFEAQKVPFRALTHYDVLVKEALEAGYIAPGDQKTLQQWRENPDGWGALYA